MAAFPKKVTIHEEGPREGFQIEPTLIPTARKIEFIDMLGQTGLTHIQIVSFVSPKRVPNMADAEQVAAGITPRAGVAYTGLILNDAGLRRAVACKNLTVTGDIALCASEAFLKRNQNRTFEEQVAAQRTDLALYNSLGVPVENAVVMAAFGCNFEGDVPVARVVSLVETATGIAAEQGVRLKKVSLTDTMAWATPDRIKQAVGAVQDRFPDLSVALHLHDTRGMGVANAYAGLEMGVAEFDACVGGLGGCPFAGHKGAAGNVCTEDLAFMCEEMGIETGLDIGKLIACARLAEEIVGHPLPGALMSGGPLSALRKRR
jgi:hydroxymethylglutaryl-CoA lyase